MNTTYVLRAQVQLITSMLFKKKQLTYNFVNFKQVQDYYEYLACVLGAIFKKWKCKQNKLSGRRRQNTGSKC